MKFSDRRNGQWPGYHLQGLSAGLVSIGDGFAFALGAFHDDVFRVLYVKKFVGYPLADHVATIKLICRKWRVPKLGSTGRAVDFNALRQALPDVDVVPLFTADGISKADVEMFCQAEFQALGFDCAAAILCSLGVAEQEVAA